MLLRFFKSNLSVIYLLFPLLGIALWLNSLLSPAGYNYYNGENALPLFKIFSFFLKTTLSQVIAGIFIMVVCAFMIEQINSRYAFIKNRTLLPATLFILLVCGISGLQVLHPVWVGALFFLMVILRSFSACDVRKPYSVAFDSGFLLGVGSLFYLNLVVLLPAIVIGIGILGRESGWREPLILITGFFLPWIFAFTGYFVFDDPMVLAKLVVDNVLTWNIHVKTDIPLLVYLGFLTIIVFASSAYMLLHYSEGKVSSRKYFVVFFVLFLFLLISFLVIPSVSQEVFILVFIPVTFLMSNYLVSIRSRFWGELIFTILVIIVIGIQLIKRFDLLSMVFST